MKIKHKKLLLSGIAAITAGVLGAGALFVSSVSDIQTIWELIMQSLPMA